MPLKPSSPQVTDGAYTLLSHPWVYQLSQNVLGISRLRERLIRDHIQPEPGNRILDIGCGPANILANLPADIEYTGYDLNPSYIASARERFGSRGEFLNERFDEHTVLAADRKYDRIIAIGFLHHIDDDAARQFFKATRDALSPTGKVITIDVCLMVRQPLFVRTMIRMDRGRHVRNPDQYKQLTQPAFSHVRQSFRDDLLFVPQHFMVQECFP